MNGGSRAVVRFARVGPRLGPAAEDRLWSWLPPAEAEHLGRLRRWQDRQRGGLVRVLLALTLAEVGHGSGAIPDLWRDDNGRPFLPQGPDLSLSHAGDLVACALAEEGRVGLDLEPVRPVPLADFRRAFHDGEWAELESQDPPWPDFFRLWTAKECAAKADGRGLLLGPLGIAVAGDQARIQGRVWWLTPLDLDPGYAACLARDRPGSPPDLAERSREVLDRLAAGP